MPDPMQSADDRRRYANALRLASERRMAALTQQLVGGQISLQDWQLAMREELRRSALEQYITGKGGDPTHIQATDYLALGPELKSQYQYLSKFARAIDKASQDGKSLDFAVQRAKLYAKSTQAIFWQSAIPVRLPQYPRDGQTACRGNCQCRLRLQYEYGDGGEVVATLVWWQLSPAEHCEDCLTLARTWNPLRLATAAAQESDLAQGIELLLMETPALRPLRDEVYAIYGLERVEVNPC
ncbi:MAG: hypothetical protein F9K46_00100 [Anaerolineae bacterium]|nr:MAG: hypothetical protein F9K46_00100 [Anaerolineae bacterium]